MSIRILSIIPLSVWGIVVACVWCIKICGMCACVHAQGGQSKTSFSVPLPKPPFFIWQRCNISPGSKYPEFFAIPPYSCRAKGESLWYKFRHLLDQGHHFSVSF